MAMIAFATDAAHLAAFAAASMLHLEIVECKGGYISAQPAPRLNPCAGLAAIELPKRIRRAHASQHALPVTADRTNRKERSPAAVPPCVRLCYQATFCPQLIMCVAQAAVRAHPADVGTRTVWCRAPPRLARVAHHVRGGARLKVLP
jgi:hypothetical protein